MNKKKYRIAYKTFGCKVNQYETEKIAEALETENTEIVEKIIDADALIINSCAVTEAAVTKLRKYINSAKNEKNRIKIILTGCAVDYLKKKNELIENADVLLNVNDKQDMRNFKNILSLNRNNDLSSVSRVITEFKKHSRAFVKIQDGCDNFCSYCIIPYLRTKMISRAEDEVLNEIKTLIENGYYEIILTGINMQKYNFNNLNLTGLLKKICTMPYDFRIRLSSINVAAVTAEFIDFFAYEKKICGHLHISLQSGSDRILKLMNRGYTAAQYLETVKNIRNARPDTAITTDVITGFPSETEEDFNQTADMLEKIKSVRTHIFPYSDRKGSKAADFAGKISETEKKKRVEKLKKIAGVLTDDFVMSRLNKSYRVVPEKEKMKIFGYTDNYIRGSFSDIEISGTDCQKKYYDVTIIDYNSSSKIALFKII